MEIPFTQYVLPDGRRKPVSIERPDDVGAAAQRLIDQGYRFECEVLGDMKTVSLTVVSPDEDEGDIAIELCPNGPGLLGPAVDRLVAEASRLAAGEAQQFVVPRAEDK